METIQLYILLFFIYSFIGWISEIILIFIETKKIVNRGFLIGPYLPIYGIGSVLVMLLLSDKVAHPLFIFFESMIICGSVEYLISFFMELLFKARWWDYSNNKFNINGRICLLNLILFGLGCIFLLYLINPILIDKINLLSSDIIEIVSLILLSIFIFDLLITLIILFKIKNRIKITTKDSTEEISELVKKELLKSTLLTKRLVISFPDFKILYKRIKNKLK